MAFWSVPTLNDDLSVEDWLGRPCPKCAGTGEDESQDFGRIACRGCGGTGEEYGFVCFAPIVGRVEPKAQANG